MRLLAANGEAAMAVPLLRNFGNGLDNGSEMLLAARLAQDIGAHHVAIAIANAADQRGTPLDLFSFPKDGLPDSAQLAAERVRNLARHRRTLPRPSHAGDRRSLRTDRSGMGGDAAARRLSGSEP